MDWRSRLLGRAEDEVRPSIEKRVEAGTVLFRAGDPAQAVALILDGEIELSSEAEDGVTRVTAIRGRGAYVGDDAILGDGVWHQTARTLRRTRLEMLPRDVFLERVAERSPSEASLAPVIPAGVVRLLPASSESAEGLPAEGMVVAEFPFVVGRAETANHDDSALKGALLLEDRRPYRLSRRHFAILRTADGPAVVDLGSRLGTFLDGQRLGAEPTALPAGQPVEIVAGGANSPYRFKLVAE